MAKTTAAPRTFRTHYTRSRDLDSQVSTGTDSMTQQNFEAECNINTIMSRYLESGLLPGGTAATAMYGDFSTVTDYRDALETLSNAKDQFAHLSATVRERFRNDPGEFLNFIHDPANKAEAQKLGLLKAEPPPPTPPAAPTPPTDKSKP